jgi:hypothetical protein
MTTTSVVGSESQVGGALNGTNASAGGAGGGGAGGGASGGTEGGQVTTTTDEVDFSALTLDIFDICSGKMTDVLSISEGMRFCLGQANPYYLTIVKNSTQINVTFDNEGRNETLSDILDLNGSLADEERLVGYVFVEDIATVSNVIQAFDLRGNTSDFRLGEYYLNTVEYISPDDGSHVSKMVAAVPIYMNKNAADIVDWKEMKFYLYIPGYEYYLGKVWVRVSGI